MTPYLRTLLKSTGSWREVIAREMLAAEATGGSGEYALLKSLRQRRPGVRTLKIPIPDFGRYMSFLQDKTNGLRTLISGAHEEHDHHDRSVPTLSWHVCWWGGERIELVGLPDPYEDFVMAVCNSEGLVETLRTFARGLEEYCRRPQRRALVYASGKWHPDTELDTEIGKVSWEDVILPEEQEVEIRAAVENFFSRREIYHSLGFAWRRGVLLVGPPGTGKTMVCKAAAAALSGLPFLYVRDLSSSLAREEELIANVFSRARELSPCVLVFEDIDGFVNDHNRAVFLGELDGFKDNDGMLVLASSNHPERVDEALLKRPSRFDRVFKIGLPASHERERYCLKLTEGLNFIGGLSGELDAEKLSADVARCSNGFTPAHLKEAFLGAALELAHNGTGPGTDDTAGERYARTVLEHVEKLKRYAAEARDPGRLAESRGGLPPGFNSE